MPKAVPCDNGLEMDGGSVQRLLILAHKDLEMVRILCLAGNILGGFLQQNNY